MTPERLMFPVGEIPLYEVEGDAIRDMYFAMAEYGLSGLFNTYERKPFKELIDEGNLSS